MLGFIYIGPKAKAISLPDGFVENPTLMLTSKVPLY